MNDHSRQNPAYRPAPIFTILPGFVTDQIFALSGAVESPLSSLFDIHT